MAQKKEFKLKKKTVVNEDSQTLSSKTKNDSPDISSTLMELLMQSQLKTNAVLEKLSDAVDQLKISIVPQNEQVQTADETLKKSQKIVRERMVFVVDRYNDSET
jgi:hypothetical protein